MKKKIILLLGIFLGLALLLLTTKPLIFEEKNDLWEFISPTTLPKPTWKLYTNQKYDYQILYPASWQAEEWDIGEAAKLKRVPDGSIWHQARFSDEEGRFEVLIWENASEVPVRTWLTWFRHEDLILKDMPKKENFAVDEIPAIRFVQAKTAKDKPLLYIFFGKDGKVYEFVEEREDLAEIESPTEEQLVHPIYDKIIESFKFLEGNQEDVLGYRQ